MASGQVLFHRFYCKKSFLKFNVKRLAATCIWAASKLEENPRKARHVINVFHRMKCRRANKPIENLDSFSKKYAELKLDLINTERHLLKEMGFVCQVEHPHKFISNYIATLGTPPELRQEAWNLANDSLRTTLCVRFKSEVVACGVVYAAARRFQIPLSENPPWWKAFDADKSGIDEVCRVLAHLYSLPKAQYIAVCKEGGSFSATSEAWDPQPMSKEDFLSGPQTKDDPKTDTTVYLSSGWSKESLGKAAASKLKESKKNARLEAEGGRIKENDREKDRFKVRERKRGRDYDRENQGHNSLLKGQRRRLL